MVASVALALESVRAWAGTPAKNPQQCNSQLSVAQSRLHSRRSSGRSRGHSTRLPVAGDSVVAGAGSRAKVIRELAFNTRPTAGVGGPCFIFRSEV